MPPELISLLQKSNNQLLHQIFKDNETESQIKKGPGKTTVVSKFKVGSSSSLHNQGDIS